MPEIPDELIQPDIAHARSLASLDWVVGQISRYYEPNTDEFNRDLQKFIKVDAFIAGITSEENLMIDQRYRFARDVKMLTLGAEIVAQGSTLSVQDGNISLPKMSRQICCNLICGKEGVKL